MFPNDVHNLSSLGKINYFEASNFLIFMFTRFAMLHIFHKLLSSGDRTESCL